LGAKRIRFAREDNPRHIPGGWQMIAAGASWQRKVRTPPGSMPRKMRGGGGPKPGAMESVTENKPPAAQAAARMKRRGKSPPPGAQAPGHDKPHAVQDKTGSRAACPAVPTAQAAGTAASGY